MFFRSITNETIPFMMKQKEFSPGNMFVISVCVMFFFVSFCNVEKKFYDSVEEDVQ